MSGLRRTGRWRGIAAVALFVGGVGVLATRPALLLVGVVGTVYAAYPGLTAAPNPRLDLDRELETVTPDHGAPVEVTVTVENVGQQILADLRLVDGVPPRLTVIDGSPRHAAVLEPGGSTSFTYTIEAEYGHHQFEPATVLARDVAGASEVETTVAQETTVECEELVPEVPLRNQTRQLAGRIVTDEGGSGTEFHRTREYRHGDPLNRIDWKRHARTGELATIEFREERAAAVVLLVDAREAAYRAPEGDPHAVAHSRSAARGLITTLGESRDMVGLAAIGRELCWVPPGAGRDHLDHARRVLASHPTFAASVPDDSVGDPDEQVAELRRHIQRDTQVLVLSPLTDEFIARTALEFEADGHAVSVISPDVTDAETPGGRLALVERNARTQTLREAGIRVIDWTPDSSVGTALLDAQEWWSA